MRLILLLSATAVLSQCKPTAKMCYAFAKFASKWNPLPETLLSWSRDNCDKIRPRPPGMSCDDIVQFVSDCNFGVSSSSVGAGLSNRELSERYQQQYYGNYPKVLPKYTYYNRQTAVDYGRHGNWYYPNYYPPSYLGNFDGREMSIQQLENDYKFAKGGNYPYNRADNVVNIGLQQTYLPTCLHDLFYCVRMQNAARRPYEETTKQRERERANRHRTSDTEDWSSSDRKR